MAARGPGCRRRRRSAAWLKGGMGCGSGNVFSAWCFHANALWPEADGWSGGDRSRGYG